ncbi:phage coat protein [Vreelandella andesensis]|uniref:Phage coat protein n=1 Tax=Vreelandella andesensis TaxID=447567 RepID=A0A3S1DHU0_9GAMM|nr:phage coat protein [Halomonas andesensis]RUR26839.1 phage coat protein [Halomonas andesensis]
MATVRLSDIIDTTVFQDLPPVNDPMLTRLLQSGVITRSALLNSIANAPGRMAELPFWNDLDPNDEPNMSNDDPASTAAAKKVVQGKQIGYVSYLNQGWSETDLAAEMVMGGRAMNQIRSRVDTYWNRQWQKRLISAALGVLADNEANGAGDMLYATTTDPFTKAGFIKSAGTMGDLRDQITAMAVHSSVRDQMDFNDQIDYIRDSEGNLIGESYSGKLLIVDDGLPAIDAGTGNIDYISVLFGAGAFGYGEGTPTTPTEVEREASQGNGAGVETLWSRKTWLLHPFGYQASAPTGQSHTRAELESAANWARVVPRKTIPMAFLRTRNDGEIPTT